MIEILFLFLVSPFSITNNADNLLLSFSVVAQEKQKEEQFEEFDKNFYGEEENIKQQASIAGIFKLNNNLISNQNFFMLDYLGSINTLVFGIITKQKEKEVLPEEPKRKFIQITEGCFVVVDSNCALARSGAGEEFEELYKLRVDTFLEVDEIITNDKSEVWYKVKHEEDLPRPERIKGEWFVSEEYVTVVELAIEPVFDQDKNKKIVIDISEQILRAYENDELVRESSISTGLSGRHATPEGEFQISKKIPSRYMQAPSPGIEDWYDLPGVPFVMYFSDEGEAIHGTYWHDKFGRRWSHGCVNVPFSVSKFSYEWAPLDTKVVVER